MLVVPGKLQMYMIDNIPQLEPEERSTAPETRPDPTRRTREARDATRRPTAVSSLLSPT